MNLLPSVPMLVLPSPTKEVLCPCGNRTKDHYLDTCESCGRTVCLNCHVWCNGCSTLVCQNCAKGKDTCKTCSTDRVIRKELDRAYIMCNGMQYTVTNPDTIIGDGTSPPADYLLVNKDWMLKYQYRNIKPVFDQHRNLVYTIYQLFYRWVGNYIVTKDGEVVEF